MTNKIKIVSAIYYPSIDRKVLAQIIKSNIELVRLGFLFKDYKTYIDLIKEIRKSESGIVLDLPSQDIKLGKMQNNSQELLGQDLIIVAANSDLADINIADLDYKVLPVSDRIKSGHLIKSDRIFINNGLVRLLVDRIEDNLIYAKVIQGGLAQTNNNVIVAGYISNMKFLDKDIVAAINLKTDYLSLLISDVTELKRIKKILANSLSSGKKIATKLIVRLESLAQVKSIMDLVKLADGLFIDHQRLSWQVPEIKLAMIEKELADKCHSIDKEVLSSLN
ncbi:hypothetical protein HOD19_04530 [bacterium]|nr:hypothetical protein [bacterium]MBT4649010.1 hypothetical protein [bacterium]